MPSRGGSAAGAYKPTYILSDEVPCFSYRKKGNDDCSVRFGSDLGGRTFDPILFLSSDSILWKGVCIDIYREHMVLTKSPHDLSTPVDVLTVTGIVAVVIFLLARRGRVDDVEFVGLVSGLVALILLVTRVRSFVTTEAFVTTYGSDDLLSLPRKVQEMLEPKLKRVSKSFKGESTRPGEEAEDVTVDENNLYITDTDKGDDGKVREDRLEELQYQYKYVSYVLCRLKYVDYDVYKRFLAMDWVPGALYRRREARSQENRGGRGGGS